MRLIDADFVKQRMNETMSSDYVYTTIRIKNLIDEAPTIDAEPVVRCKDCKYSYEDLQSRVCAYGRCLNCDVSDDWFCADGERDDGGT